MYFHPLNFIRFILASGVLLFHYGLDYYPFSSGSLHTLIVNSSFRVSFFFFISGFVMGLVYGRGQERLEPVYFYKKRLSRIFPVYWLAFIFTLLAVLFIKGSAPKGLVIILHALGLQSWNPGYVLDLNFTTWSVSVELFFYSLFPFVINVIKKVSIRTILIFMVLVWVIQSLQHYYFVNYLSDGSKRTEEFISAFPLWHLGTFLLGVATARMVLLDAIPALIRNYATAWFILSLLVFGVIIFIPNPFLKYIHNGLLAPVYMLTIVSLFYEKSVIGKILGSAPLSNLGNLSYGIFIFQYPMWLVMNASFTTGFTSSSLFFYLYYLGVLLFSALMYRYFEKPVLKMLRGRIVKA